MLLLEFTLLDDSFVEELERETDELETDELERIVDELDFSFFDFTLEDLTITDELDSNFSFFSIFCSDEFELPSSPQAAKIAEIRRNATNFFFIFIFLLRILPGSGEQDGAGSAPLTRGLHTQRPKGTQGLSLRGDS